MLQKVFSRRDVVREAILDHHVDLVPNLLRQPSDVALQPIGPAGLRGGQRRGFEWGAGGFDGGFCCGGHNFGWFGSGVTSVRVDGAIFFVSRCAATVQQNNLAKKVQNGAEKVQKWLRLKPWF